MDNLEKSERVISSILHCLIQTGFQRNTLGFSDLGLDDQYQPFFSESAKWLLSERIIRATKAEEHLDGNLPMVNPQITAFGFKILGQTIEVGGSQETLGKAVEKVSETGKSYSTLGDFFGGLLGGFTKSISS